MHANVGNPVNVTNGNMYVQQTDYSLPGMGDGLEITRTFNSANTGRTGLFGNGWATQYDKSLNVYGAKLLRLNLADGRAVYFKGLTATTFAPLSPLVQAEPKVFHANINEDAKVGLVGVAADAGDQKLIILIAHRGTKESRAVNQRRLRTAREYLHGTHAIGLERIVTAEGNSVRGSGRLDVYIDGKLHSRFDFFKRNRDFAPEP